MKIVITEDQHNRLVEMKIMNESIEKFKKAAFSIWDDMKRNGERPALIDIIYDLMDVGRNTRGDYKIIRPIWYEYNGGFNGLVEKLNKEIKNKTFKIVNNIPLLDGQFRVRQINVVDETHWPHKILEVICEVDKNSMIEYQIYDDEDSRFVDKRDTLEQAFDDLEYDDEGLEDFISRKIYNVIERIAEEKYGLPIHIDIELVDFN